MLDPQVAALLAASPPWDPAGTPVGRLRADYNAMVALRQGPDWVPEEVASTVEVTVEGVTCRLYRPAVERLALLVWFHGGGWVVGGLDSHDGICRSLCARGGFAVLSVDYRLAPEHPFPAPLEDCLAAARWATEQEEFASVSVGGDSAGGNLAAAVALVFRAEGRPLACQLLAYPCLDAHASLPSYDENAEGFGLEAQSMRWYWAQYAGSHALDEPLLSPSATPDLAGLAPAVIVTAEHDVLRDEGDRYAARLQQAGVPVWTTQYAGMVHGFFGQTGAVAAADAAVTEIALAVGDLIRP